MAGFDVVVTDFGTTKIPRVAAYMDRLDPKWREIVANKRRRGKHATWLRDEASGMVDAVMALAKLEWSEGGHLEAL